MSCKLANLDQMFRRITRCAPFKFRPLRTVVLIGCIGCATPLAVQAQPGAAVEAADALAVLDTDTNDLIRLAESYSDAVRDMKIARLNIETVKRLPPNAVVTSLEVQVAALNFEGAQRKVQVLRKIVEKQLAAAEAKLEVLKYFETVGRDANQAARAANQAPDYARKNDEATIEILKLILSMN